MQIIKQDLRNGIITLKIQSPDDLWHLEKVLEPGDLIKARTVRKETIQRGDESVKGDRKPVTIMLKMEKAEFHPSTGLLRVLGTIEEGSASMSKGSHHTIQAGTGSVLTVRKTWKKHQLERLKAAKVQEPLVLICAVDRDGACFASLKAGGVEWMGTKRYSKVWGEEKRQAFYQDVAGHLRMEKGYKAIILAGPGFEAQNLMGYLREKEPELAGRIYLEHTHSSGRAGVQEVLKKSANRILVQSRVAKESRLVEQLMEGIATDGAVTYGEKETKKAAELGAIETLLVSEKEVHQFESLMELVEKKNGRIAIISTTHEPGERFLALGGIAGILRFKIQ